MQATNGLIPESRALSAEERELTKWLVEHSGTDSSEFLAQIDKLTVASKCNCGCPTVYFVVIGQEPSRESEVILADYLATVNEHPVGVMLFQRGGLLSSLEVYSCDGIPKSFDLPKIDSLRPLDSPPQE